MATQSTYTDMSAAVAGAIGNMVPATLISRTVEDSAGIGFGVAVKDGSADYGCAAFGSGDTAILGITVRERDVSAVTPDKFAQYENARVMTKGCVWVTCTTGCSPGDPVYVRPSDGTFQDSSANSGVQIAGARWDTTATAGAIALIRMG